MATQVQSNVEDYNQGSTVSDVSRNVWATKQRWGCFVQSRLLSTGIFFDFCQSSGIKLG